ncbi:MAG TPA: 23S rRNA (cytosine(2499)-C(5))-methyltransferase [Verrucomicrobiales bacterium]|nr:23S rRNA (cytosine(2499)-C(5))-methyltransferase [Verrucomicrobiales bacterium]
MQMPPASKPEPRLRLRVSPVAESRLRSGHPWLFSDSVREQNREGRTGELAVVYDRKDRFLAIGLYDPDSPIRLRVLHAGSPVQITPDWWAARIRESRLRREGLFDTRTTGHRWIHGESDGWPGLVLDRYDTTLVLKVYSGVWLPLLAGLIPQLVAEWAPERLVLRLSRNLQGAAAAAGFQDGGVLRGAAPPGPVVFLETGIAFEADVVRGQKTGFFLDQRENRRWVESVSAGRRVLNAFSFSGGFSLYAARGGAASVTDLDISSHALESAARNFRLNEGLAAVRACRHDSVQADAFEWLAAGERAGFDLVVLDPPSLAKRESERAGAIQAYRRLARLGWQRVRPGGILAAASCSAHVRMEEFVEATLQGVRDAGGGGEAREVHRAGHPPDHPATFPEALYLKCLALSRRG